MTEDRRHRVIALMNQKGGVGKTTTVANLGAALAELGATVLMVDLDPQAHLTYHVGIDPANIDQSIYDLLIEPDIDPASIVRQFDERLWVLPSEVNLAGADTELVNEPDRQKRLKARLQPIVEAYDYVLIDCPPSLGLLSLNALTLANEVIVPMQAHFLPLQGLSKLLETVQAVRQNMNPALQVTGVVLCVHDAQTRLATEVIEDLRKFFEASRPMALPWSNAVVFDPPIRRNIKLAECPSFGQTIFQYAPWCPGANDYRQLAESIHGVSDSQSSRAAPAEPETSQEGEPQPEQSDPPRPPDIVVKPVDPRSAETEVTPTAAEADVPDHHPHTDPTDDSVLL